MSPDDLARVALARLPKPYTDEVTLHVFCEIERTPHLRLIYDQLDEHMDHKWLNSRIGKVIAETLNATRNGKIEVEDGTCEIVKGPSRLSFS